MHHARLDRVAALAAVSVLACSSTTTTAPSNLSSPAGMAMAGPSLHDLYVANPGEGSVQVLRFGTNPPVTNPTVANYAWLVAPSFYAPLRIPVGPYLVATYPTGLASTPDGRYVVVLDALGEALYVIDANPPDGADPLLVMEADGVTPVTLPLGPPGSAPIALKAAPVATACIATKALPCAVDFYITLSGQGTIAVAQLTEDADLTIPTLGLRNVLSVGGAPTQLAVSPNNQLLYATDANLPGDKIAELVRIDIGSGAISRLKLSPPAVSSGAPITREQKALGGAIEVSGDGRVLIVARPSLQDIVFFDGADTQSPKLVDANANAAVASGGNASGDDANRTQLPVPACRRQCTDDANTVDGNCPSPNQAHPSDLAMCLNPDGSLSDSTDYPKYQGLYLGASPERLLAFHHDDNTPTSDLALFAYCSAGTLANVANDYVLVATDRDALTNSTLAFVSWDRTPDPVTGTIRPKIVRSDTCAPVTHALATTQVGNITTPFSTFLANAACPTPSDRVGFDCFSQQDPDHVVANIEMSATVAMIVGPNVTSTWQLEWEAPVLDRVAGGSIESDGSLNDPDVDFLSADVRAGDILQILTPASISDSDCKNALDNDPVYTDDVHNQGVVDTDLCLLERRISGVLTNQLVLENPLPHFPPGQSNNAPAGAPCFPSAGEIAYKVRMGRQYQVTSPGYSARLGIVSGTNTWGPAGYGGASSPVIFKLQDNLAPVNGGTTETFPTGGWDACIFVPAATADDFHRFGRDAPFAFTVTSGFAPLISGVQPANSAAAAGYLPSGLIAAPSKYNIDGTDAWSGSYPPVFLAYAGSNAILAFVPYDLNNLFTGDHYAEIN